MAAVIVALMADDDDNDGLIFDLDDRQRYELVTRKREAAEKEHGREKVDEVVKEYARIRVALQQHFPAATNRTELRAEARQLEETYGYVVVAGAPRVVRGNDPVHDWKAKLEDTPDRPPTE